MSSSTPTTQRVALQLTLTEAEARALARAVSRINRKNLGPDKPGRPGLKLARFDEERDTQRAFAILAHQLALAGFALA